MIIAAVVLVLLILGAVLAYFFSIAFVKQNMGDIDDMDSPVNKPLEAYKKVISEGIEFVRTYPHQWVYSISFDGLKLAARYYDNNSTKTIILMHGYRSSSARDFSCAVKMYLEMGFNILLCDQRCHGRSEGRLLTFGVKESRDALMWAEYVKEKYRPEKIVLDGISMGATTVLLALGEELPQEVSAVVADCGFTSPKDIITKVAKDSFKINAKHFLPILDLLCRIIGGFSVLKADARQTVKGSTIPILFVHGKADNFVPCCMSEELYSFASPESRIITVENAGHGLSFLTDQVKVRSELKSFFEENL